VFFRKSTNTIETLKEASLLIGFFILYERMNMVAKSRKSLKPKDKNHQPKPASSQGTTLEELLTSDVANQLKSLKKEQEKEVLKQKEEELKRKQEEIKLREKNKSFGELFSESHLDWKKFK
jgi:hypothetical protein